MTRVERRKQRKKRRFILCITILIFMLISILAIYSHNKNTNVKAASITTTVSKQAVTSAYISNTPTSQATQETIEPRYGFTDDDIYLLAQLLCGSKNVDGDGEYDIDFKDPENLNYYEISKVFCVVMNRVRDERFPNTVKEVVMAKGQFAVMPKNSKKTPSDIAIKVTTEWCDAYDGNDIGIQCVPEDHVYFTGDGTTNETRP